MLTAKIYKRDTLGKIRFWQAEVDDVNYRTIAGVEGIPSTHVVSGWTRCVGKQGRTNQEQAEFEAAADMKKKLEREYRNAIADVDTKRSAWVKPMLAHKYEGWQGPCFSQPKLDGIRCIATASGLFSREGKEFVAAPHIQRALEPVFARYPELVFDGEFYNHDFHDDFNAIVSAVKRTKPSEADLEVSAKLVQYHVYDLPSAGAQAFKRSPGSDRRLHRRMRLGRAWCSEWRQSRVHLDDLDLNRSTKHYLARQLRRPDGADGRPVRRQALEAAPETKRVPRR